MSAALLAGVLTGLAVWVIWAGLRPTPEPLGAALARLDRKPDADPVVETLDRDTRFGRFLMQRIPPLARAVERMRTDLRIIGRRPEEQAVRIGMYVLIALFMGPWTALVARFVGLALPIFVPAVVMLGGVAWGLGMPFVALRREAAARRKVFAHTLSAWCDVVVMSLAAGRGVEQAMETAATAGAGWGFAELRGAIHAGYVRGEPPWVAIGQLGRDLGIAELSQLSSTISMAGEEGAAVRSTVAAKARTIREAITADAEAAAASATEKMSLPTVLMVLGFLIFLVYPAVTILFEIGGGR